MGFPYIREDGRQALYVPDFYIFDLDLWVETKGYMVKNDTLKIQQFPHRIKLIGKSLIFDQFKWGF